MKNIIFTTLFIFAAFSISGFAQDGKLESLFTEISDKTCKDQNLADRSNGILGVSKCQGASGYSLEIVRYEHGQRMSLQTPAGEKFFIDLFTPMGEESYLRKEIEWRGVQTGDTFKPTALIFEHKIFQRMAPDRDPEIKIAVVRIQTSSACLIAAAFPNKNFQMTEARRFADYVNMPCLTENDVSPPSAFNEEYSSVKEFLESNMSKRGSGVLLRAKGDLNGDGLEDWAAVVWDTRPDVLGGEEYSTLYVLLRDKEKGVFRVDGMSEEGMIHGSICCNVEDVRIKNQSVYLQINAHSDGAIRATTYQFKHQNNYAWRLIGLRIYNAFSGDESRADSAIETDMNLLTGDVIVTWHKEKGKPERKRRREKFDEFYLSEFDFGNVPAEQYEEPPDWVQ